MTWRGLDSLSDLHGRIPVECPGSSPFFTAASSTERIIN
ncbi:hypothetical protein FOXB_03758 [Fusarium oxysporum f. sp. conglutinans Fo5176]|uniref:Uncharacterized protein n=1 Tax=Fusarium oxysporum (strain Fo5176) TaxID=660025 RepID=F9FBI2_FUSOF|nr:hypothetical protein FOXB_03758 [Fusarium oxysporum f. sp. conglutinans Fo5176]